MNHHDGDFNASILNSSPMHNFGCHIDNGKLHHVEYEIALLKKTYQALTQIQNYKLTERDIRFIGTYYETHFIHVLEEQELAEQARYRREKCSSRNASSAKKSRGASGSKSSTNADHAQ